MKKVLLHICCGVCAGYPVEALREDGFDVTGFFYNPNIGPKDEYLRRLDAAKKAALIFDYRLIEGDYDDALWMESVSGFHDEPEGGRRCAPCFRMRLKETAKRAVGLGFDLFATTLSVSPHKDAMLINDIGRLIGGDRFLERDFKKQDGFKKTMRAAKDNSLYRQNYCGCIFSKKMV